MIRTYIFKIALALWFIVWTPLLLPMLITRRTARCAARGCSDGVIWLCRIICQIRYRVHNQPKNITGIVAAKHASILEVAILFRTVPNAFFILKRELLWIPVYGWTFARMGFIGVNRKRGATSMKTLADMVAKKIAAGGTLVIYPEGTRKMPGAAMQLKRGLLFIAEAVKLPIYPVGSDSGLYWPRRGYMRSGTTNTWFEKTLPYDAPLDTIGTSIQKHSA